ncbi:MAG: efflux RND transporter periplasmic adaptor subunit [Bryobacteraceae bacterium]
MTLPADISKLTFSALALSVALAAQAPVDVVRVAAATAGRKLSLPGELQPWMTVPVHAKITGFVEQVLVDRGSAVRQGELLATLVAPELKAQRAEAEARAQAAQSQETEAQSRLAAAESTYERLKAASATPGAIAGNELLLAEKAVESARAQVRTAAASVKAAEAAVAAIRDTEAYLQVTAPFSGVITERNAHPGALAGPAGAGAETPMFRLEQTERLRLVVAVPETDIAGIAPGTQVTFSVPAWTGQTFHATLRRAAHSLDPKTRSMPVELDVSNPRLRLAPGMYCTVQWPVRPARGAVVVPLTSVVTTTERTFVVRVRNGAAEWITVTKGPAEATQVQVYGPLAPGDLIVERASDEIRQGTRLNVRKKG